MSLPVWLCLQSSQWIEYRPAVSKALEEFYQTYRDDNSLSSHTVVITVKSESSSFEVDFANLISTSNQSADAIMLIDRYDAAHQPETSLQAQRILGAVSKHVFPTGK
jgi:hypothetical protein